MQELASEFSKNFPGVIPPEPHSGNPLPHPTPRPAFDRARGASAPVLGPKPWSPSTFQPCLRPCFPHTNPTKHDRQRGYVLPGICLSVCLSVSNFM